jgi:hypothetical protein
MNYFLPGFALSCKIAYNKKRYAFGKPYFSKIYRKREESFRFCRRAA